MTDAEAKALLKALHEYVTNEHPAEDYTITELADLLCNVGETLDYEMDRMANEIESLL